jgi:UDP-N-acetylmuramoyl-L-alanyl-D-glutamate--2,6-diaminopimelate ligase
MIHAGRPLPAPRSARLGELASAWPGATLTGDADITGITYDSRRVQASDLFAALVGDDFDGHSFADRAIAAGAAALLVERHLDIDIPQLVVDHSRAALAPISTQFYGRPSNELTATGITGTDGKTTTTFILDAILRHVGHATGLIGTVGIRIGAKRDDSLPHQSTPESNLVQGYLREMVEAGVTQAILESTSHGLAMHRLDGVRFRYAGVTNITREHLEFHKTIEAYRAAKAILVERVAEERGTVVLNADDEGAMSLAAVANSTDVITYSAGGGPAHLRATDIDISVSGCTFTLHWRGARHSVTLPLLGRFNVANALCAAGLALAQGIAVSDVVDALATAPGVPGRLLRVDEGQAFSVVVDYAHTPESLEKILALLRDLHPGGRLIAVSGSAGERDTTKRPLQGAVSQRLADVSIFTNEDPRNEDPERILQDIAQGAIEAGGVEGENVHCIADREEAIACAFSLAAPGDCVLLAGKGHESSIIVGYDHRPWNEEAVARRLLRERA